MTWNHRVVRIRDSVGGPLLGIYEVYYDDDKPNSRTTDPVGLIADGDESEAMTELRETLERMLRCLDQPILDDEEYFKED